MKLLLAVENPPILSNYRIISPLNGENPLDLSSVDDAEVDEIICHHMLKFVAIENLVQYIQLLVKKLAHKARLIIVENDSLVMNQEYYHGRLSTKDFNVLMFGQKNHAWAFHQSCSSLHEIREIVRSLGLKITSCKLNNIQYSLICERA